MKYTAIRQDMPFTLVIIKTRRKIEEAREGAGVEAKKLSAIIAVQRRKAILIAMMIYKVRNLIIDVVGIILSVIAAALIGAWHF